MLRITKHEAKLADLVALSISSYKFAKLKMHMCLYSSVATCGIEKSV
jgi:hypothetical protein